MPVQQKQTTCGSKLLLVPTFSPAGFVINERALPIAVLKVIDRLILPSKNHANEKSRSGINVRSLDLNYVTSQCVL